MRILNRIYERNTSETTITFKWLDEGETAIETPCPFIEHMLKSMFFYSGLKVSLFAEGDVDIDYHHLVEDTGIVIGQAIRESFAGSKIQRFGNTVMPMDEALIMVALDISGRSGSYWDIYFNTEKCGDFDLEVLEEFWKALAREAKLTIHFKMLSGKNSHHIAEAAFKGAGLALGQALQYSDRIKSTKGSLD